MGFSIQIGIVAVAVERRQLEGTHVRGCERKGRIVSFTLVFGLRR
jgi:hypothetical protein